MYVLTIEHAPDSLKGELKRYMYAINPTTFVGNITAKVADLLWQKISEYPEAAASLISQANNEQGFTVKSIGDPSRELIETDGLTLASFPYVFRHPVFKAKSDTRKYLLCHLLETAVMAKEQSRIGLP